VKNTTAKLQRRITT